VEVVVRVRLTKQGDRLTVDFTDSDGQIKGFKNSSLANTTSAVYTALSAFFDPSIPRNSGAFRSVEIIGEGKLPDENRPTKLPMLGNIAAGSPIEAIENREEVDLEKMFHSRSGVYVLRVRGESMIDDHLCDGDYVVIERRESARNGEQVVALLDTGEATLKRFYREPGNKIRLQPANSTMQPRIVESDRVRVQGVVIGVLRSSVN
jgi:repressor LexA